MAWALLLTVALAVFVLLLARTEPGDYGASAAAASTLVAALCVALVVGCVAVASRMSGPRRAVLLAAAVGVLFGVVAVLTKIVMHMLIEGGVRTLLTTPALYVLVLMGAAATLLQQSAFHAGALQVSVPTMLVLEPVVAVLLGAVVLGEHLDVSGFEAVALMIAIVAMAAATVALGRDEGAYEEELEATTAGRSA